MPTGEITNMNITFTNSFHNTAATVRVPANMLITASQEKRMARKLCGYEGCVCGGLGGVRGGKWHLDYTSPDNGPYLVVAA